MKRSSLQNVQIALVRNAPSTFKWIRPAVKVASLLASLAVLSVCASADTVIISQDGSWGTGPNCPAIYCTSPGDSWQWSFEMDANPAPSSFTLGGNFEAAISNFEFLDAATLIPSLTDSQTEVTFFSVAQCGGLSTDDQTTVNECADNQLYSGDESAPTLVPGTYNPELIPEVGGCGDTPGAACSGVTFGSITVTAVAAQTPEPSTFVIAAVPLFGLAFVARKRRLRRAAFFRIAAHRGRHA